MVHVRDWVSCQDPIADRHANCFFTKEAKTNETESSLIQSNSKYIN